MPGSVSSGTIRSGGLTGSSQPESILTAALGAVLRHGRTLERAIQVSIVVTVLGSVLAAGSVLSLADTGRVLRAVALPALVLLAFACAVSAGSARRMPRGAIVAGTAFLVLAGLSTAWSATPRVTLVQVVAFGLVLFAGAALAVAASSSDAALEAAADGLVVAVGLVALGGLLLLVVDDARAIDPATTTSPARYQGLGGGPNTVTMVLAVGLPVALDAVLRWRGRLARAVAVGASALIVGSIVGSGSRGALIGAFVGVLVYALLRAQTGRGRLLAGGATAAALGVAVLLVALPDPLPSGSSNEGRGYVPPNPDPAQIVPRPPYGDANLILRLQDDVGHPGLGRPDPNEGSRRLIGSSGRIDAWAGALHQGAERPVLGHGFGTESRVFQDRYLFFNSAVPENSYVGLFLQLGMLGLLAFGALAASILVGAGRGIRSLDGQRRGLAAACAGAFAGGLALALVQSYVYAAGNNATVALWLSGFLAAGAAASVDAG